jgi:hypothetical protein
MSEGPIPAQNGQPSAVAQSPLNSANAISGPSQGMPYLDEEKKLEVIRGMSIQKIGNVRKVSDPSCSTIR